MTDGSLSTELWVAAHVRQCGMKGIAIYVAHRGAPARGTVMVKIVVRGKGCRLLNQSRDESGNMGWMDVFDGNIVDESRADQYIQRTIQRDPDVWVVEAEDAEGKNPFEGKIF